MSCHVLPEVPDEYLKATYDENVDGKQLYLYINPQCAPYVMAIALDMNECTQ